MEMNFNHGDPMLLADQAFLFKRTVREAAMRHKVYATFMAKPMQDQPGSSMHNHQSLLDAKSGRNLFAPRVGQDTALFRGHIDRQSPRLNSRHSCAPRMPSSACKKK